MQYQQGPRPYASGRETNSPDSVVPAAAVRPVVSAEEAFAYLGIDRSTGYKAIRDGTFPVPVLRIGRLIRVPTVPLRRLLQLDEPADGKAS